MTRENRPPPKETAGSRALAKVCEKYGPSAVAKRVGLSAKAIHYFESGARSPSAATRAKLAKRFAIDVELWDRGPASAPPPAAMAAAKLGPVRETIFEAEANLAVAKAGRDRALNDPNASHRDISSAAAAVDRAIARLAEARGEDEISEARIANSPAWAKLSKAVVEALKPIPGALQAFVAVCQRIVETE